MRQAERRVRCSERSRDGVSCLSGEFLNDGFGAQAVEEILDSPLLLLTMQRLFDGFPNLGEIADALGLFLVYLGDVETEGSAENIADLILFQREDYVLELLHHLTSGYPAKLAAIAGAIGGAVRQLFEIGAGFELLLNLLDRRARGRFINSLIHIFDDMTRTHKLGPAKLLFVFAIVFGQLFVLGRGYLGGGFFQQPVDAHADLDFSAKLVRPSRCAAGGLSAGL